MVAICKDIVAVVSKRPPYERNDVSWELISVTPLELSYKNGISLDTLFLSLIMIPYDPKGTCSRYVEQQFSPTYQVISTQWVSHVWVVD